MFCTVPGSSLVPSGQAAVRRRSPHAAVQKQSEELLVGQKRMGHVPPRGEATADLSQELLTSLKLAKTRSLEDGPVALDKCVPHEVFETTFPSFVESEEASGCTIEFEDDGHCWCPFLVKMEGEPPHAQGISDVIVQLGIYERACFYDDGVSPGICGNRGLSPVPARDNEPARRMNPDSAAALRGDLRNRFIFELDHKSNTPKAQAERVTTLFGGFGETVRNIITIKFTDRHRRDGRFAGFAVHYRRGEGEAIHVARAFQVGTTN